MRDRGVVDGRGLAGVLGELGSANHAVKENKGGSFLE